MNILVFASKYVGLKSIEYLISEYNSDSYTIVITDNDDIQIKKILESKGISHLNIDKFYNSLNKDLKFDWLLNLWGSHIFKTDILDKIENTLNIHPSFLPFAKGKDPIVWTIQNSYSAGVTLHKITKEIDSGGIFYQEKLDYHHPITGYELYEKILELSIDTFKKKWPIIRSNPAITQQNDESHKIYSRKDLLKNQTKEFGDESINEAILWLLSHDFSKNEEVGKDSYTAQIKINDKIYYATLKLKEKN